MASALRTSLPMPDIACVNPLEYRSALERLFAEHDRPDHAEFFARAYPGAVAEGAKAWIGLDADGRAVMHASRFPHPFITGGRRVTGGLIVNILVAKPYRTHHPARALFERFVADSRQDREVDFLYTETTDRGANVLKAAGARAIGRIGRFVLPIRGTRTPADLAIKAYHAVRRVGTGAGRVQAARHPAATFRSEPFDAPLGLSDRLRGIHGMDLYRRRLKDYPTALDQWITAEGQTVAGAALLRGPESNGLASIAKLNVDPADAAAPFVLGIASVLRETGCRAVQIYTVAESRFARELRRAGFVERASQPLVALPISSAGEDLVARIRTWQIMDLDLDN